MTGVDLLVRSWIERSGYGQIYIWKPVDLLVRSWIERCDAVDLIVASVSSTSSWGRELKESCRAQYSRLRRRPPREVVNWKVNEIVNNKISSASTSSWGRELKAISSGKNLKIIPSTSSWGRELKDALPGYLKSQSCRPPREVVNWKTQNRGNYIKDRCRPPREVVNWKAVYQRTDRADTCRPPREVVNWKIVKHNIWIIS